jgi:hypothetical protein
MCVLPPALRIIERLCWRIFITAIVALPVPRFAFA